MPAETTLLKIAYGTKAKYDAVASKVNGTLYVITDQNRLFIKLPDVDAFEINAANATQADAVRQSLTFTNDETLGNSAGTYNGSASSAVKIVGCQTIGALHSNKGAKAISLTNDKLTLTFNDNTYIESAAIKPSNAGRADVADHVGASLTFGSTSYNGSTARTITLADLLTDGKVPAEYIPASALERIYVMGSNEELIDIVIAEVQPGDIVKDKTTSKMYVAKAYADRTESNPINREKTLSFEEFAVGTAASAAQADSLKNGVTFHFPTQTFTFSGTQTNNNVYIGHYLVASGTNQSTSNGASSSGGVYLNLTNYAGNSNSLEVSSYVKLLGTSPVSVTSDVNGNITIAVATMTGATVSAAGTAGLVPAPEARGSNTAAPRYLDNTGSWSVPANNNVYHTDGSWNTGGDLLTYTATTNGSSASADRLSFTLNKASEVDPTWTDISTRSTTYGVIKGGLDRSVKISSDGVLTVPWLAGASSAAAGRGGLVPAPAAGDQVKYLRGDGAWVTPPNDDTHWTTYLVVTDATTDNLDKSGSISNGSVFINLVDSKSTGRVIESTHKIYGSAGIEVVGVVPTGVSRTDIEIKHVLGASVTGNSGADYIGTSSAQTITLNANSQFNIPSFKYDAQGHIRDVGQTTLKLGTVTTVADFAPENGGVQIATVFGQAIYTGIVWGVL